MADVWESGSERSIVPYAVFHGQPHAPFGAPGETLDALGFRNAQAPTPDKPAGEFRICVIGGSTVVLGSTREATICGRLQHHFHQAGLTHVRVFNFGAISSISGQELSLLVHTVHDLAPDCIVIYDGGNDLLQPYFYDPRPGYPFNFFIWEAAVRALRVERANGRVNFYNAPFELDVVKLRRESGFPSPEWRRAVRDRYVANLEKMRHFALGAGIPIALFFQPTVFTKPHLAGNEPATRVSPEFTQYAMEQYEQIRPLLDRFAGTQQVPGRVFWTDISGIFADVREQLYTDMIHVTDGGNDTVARRMFAELGGAFPALRPA